MCWSTDDAPSLVSTTGPAGLFAKESTKSAGEDVQKAPNTKNQTSALFSNSSTLQNV